MVTFVDKMHVGERGIENSPCRLRIWSDAGGCTVWCPRGGACRCGYVHRAGAACDEGGAVRLG